MKQSISERNAFRNTLLYVAHSSTYGPDDGRGLTETCCTIEII